MQLQNIQQQQQKQQQHAIHPRRTKKTDQQLFDNIWHGSTISDKIILGGSAQHRSGQSLCAAQLSVDTYIHKYI